MTATPRRYGPSSSASRSRQSFAGLAAPQLRHLALDLLEGARAVALEPLRQGADARDGEALRPLGTEAQAELQVHRERVMQVQGRRGRPTRVGEGVNHHVQHAIDLQHVAELVARAIDRALEVRTLEKKRAMQVGGDLVAQRLEQHEHDDAAHHGVQVHRLKLSEQLHEDVEDPAERERQRRGHDGERRHLVQIHQAFAQQRLAQHEQEHDAEHGAHRRQRHADIPEKVGEAERRRQRAARDDEASALLRGARAAVFTSAPQRPQARCEEPEHVQDDRAPHPPGGVIGRQHEQQHGQKEPARDARQVLADTGAWKQRLEQLHGELRHQHHEHGREMCPDRRQLDEIEPLREVPEPDGAAERGEVPLGAPWPPPEQHRDGDGERQRAAEQGGACP